METLDFPSLLVASYAVCEHWELREFAAWVGMSGTGNFACSHPAVTLTTWRKVCSTFQCERRRPPWIQLYHAIYFESHFSVTPIGNSQQMLNAKHFRICKLKIMVESEQHFQNCTCLLNARCSDVGWTNVHQMPNSKWTMKYFVQYQ